MTVNNYHHKEGSVMTDRVHFNFEADPDVEGGILFRAVFTGGFDKEKPLHRFCANVYHLIEKESSFKVEEQVDKEEAMPVTRPVKRIVC